MKANMPRKGKSAIAIHRVAMIVRRPWASFLRLIETLPRLIDRVHATAVSEMYASKSATDTSRRSRPCCTRVLRACGSMGFAVGPGTSGENGSTKDFGSIISYSFDHSDHLLRVGRIVTCLDRFLGCWNERDRRGRRS